MKKVVSILTLLSLSAIFVAALERRNSGHGSAQSLYEQGYRLYLQVRDKEAVDFFDKALAIEPAHLLAWCYKGTALRRLKRWTVALSAFDSALRIDKECIYALADKSLTLKLFGNKSDSETLSAKAVSIKPKENDAFGYLGRGLAYFDRGKYDLAIADFTSSLQINNQDVVTYRIRGMAYHDQGKYDLAIEDFNAAIKINPEYVDAYNNRGNVFLNQGKYKKAIKNYNSAIRINPEFAKAYHNRGLAYYYQSKFDLAIVDYSSAIRIDPNYPNAYNNRGQAYFYLGKYDLAIQDLSSAIKINPQFVMAYENRANIFAKKGDINSAKRDWEKVSELDPNGPYGAEARQKLQRLSGSAPVQRDTTDNLSKVSSLMKTARAREEAGDLQGALDIYAGVIQIFKTFRKDSESSQRELKHYATGAYNSRALIFQRMGKYQAAMEEFKEAMRLSPSLGYLFSNRGNLRAEAGDCLGAMIDFGIALRIDPQNTSPRINKALLLEKIGWYQAAIWQYDRILQWIDPNSATAWAYRGDAKRLYGLSLETDEKKAKTYLDDAIIDLNKATEIKSDFAWAYRTRGRTWLALNEFEKAARDYEKALSLNPKLTDVHEELGLVYIALKSWDRATHYLQEALNKAGESSESILDDQVVQSLADRLVNTNVPYEGLTSQMVAFNVLRNAVIDAKSGAVVLQGEYDPRYGDDPIPYFDILKTAFAYPDASFTLPWTQETKKELADYYRLYPRDAGSFHSRLRTYFQNNAMYGALLYDIFFSLPGGGIGILVPSNSSQARPFEVEADDTAKLVSMAQFFGLSTSNLAKMLVYGPTVEECLNGIESFGLPKELYFYFMPLSNVQAESSEAYFAFLEEIFRNARRQDLVEKVQFMQEAVRRGEQRESLEALSKELENALSDLSVSITGIVGIYEKLFKFLKRMDWVERTRKIRDVVQRGDLAQGNYLFEELVKGMKSEEFGTPQGLLSLMSVHSVNRILTNGIRIPPDIMRDVIGFEPVSYPEFRELPANSELARIAFEADCTLKLLTSLPWVKEAVPGHMLNDEWEERYGVSSKREPGWRWIRQWFEPGEIEISEVVSPSELTCFFGDASVKIKTGTQSGNDASGKEYESRVDESYGRFLASRFDEYARIFPSLHELRETYKIIALAKILRARGINPLPDQEIVFNWSPPKEVRGLMSLYVKPSAQRKEYVTEFWTGEGGVDLRVSQGVLKPVIMPKTAKKPAKLVYQGAGLAGKEIKVSIGEKELIMATQGNVTAENVGKAISAAGGTFNAEAVPCSQAWKEKRIRKQEERIALSKKMLQDIQNKSSSWEKSFAEYQKLAKQRASEWRLTAAFGLVGAAANGARIIKTARNLGNAIPRAWARGEIGMVYTYVRTMNWMRKPLSSLSIAQTNALQIMIPLHRKIIWKAAEITEALKGIYDDAIKEGGTPCQMAGRLLGNRVKKLATDLMTNVDLPEIAAISTCRILPIIGLVQNVYENLKAGKRFFDVANDIKQLNDEVGNTELMRQRIFESLKTDIDDLKKLKQTPCK